MPSDALLVLTHQIRARLVADLSFVSIVRAYVQILLLSTSLSSNTREKGKKTMMLKILSLSIYVPKPSCRVLFESDKAAKTNEADTPPSFLPTKDNQDKQTP